MKKLITLLFLLYSSAFAQSLSVFDLNTDNFPTIKAKFYAFDAAGNQIININPSDFEVKEDGIDRTVTNVTCPSPKPPTPLSSVLVMDASGSMGGGNLDLAKEAARAWIQGLPLGKSECAITSFNTKNYFNQDFTTDKNLLLQKVNTLSAGGGTSYNAAFLDPAAGGILVAKTGRHKRAIVFLSDGHPNYEPQTNEIINQAAQNNIIVYAVTLGMRCPQCLKDVTTQTGGQWFENITTVEQAKETYQKILQTAQGGEPCIIEWQSVIPCESGIVYVEIKLLQNGRECFLNYQSPSNLVAKLEFNPLSVKFNNAEQGIKKDTIISVKAINANFIITNIVSSNPAFTIKPASFSLNSGQSKDLTVSYTPVDSGFAFAEFEFENNVCPAKYYATGGFIGKKPSVRTIKLIHPNGGEVFVVGSDTIIIWEGVLPEEKVKLEYSTNSGASWVKIKDTAAGLKYKWRVPNTPSDQCLARVTAKAGYSFCDDVPIYTQVWMGCNLDVDHYRNGDAIRYAETVAEWQDANNKKEGAWCYYDNNPINGEIYGKLYNWYAVNDSRGLAPAGWHIPTDDEWKVLEICLGMTKSEVELTGWRGTDIGGRLKSTGTIEKSDGLWSSPNTNATNESGFFGYPGGNRGTNGQYGSIGDYGSWWTSSQFDGSYAWYRGLGHNASSVARYDYTKGNGFSVRCVKD